MSVTPLGRAVAQRGQRWLHEEPPAAEAIASPTSTAVREAAATAMEQHLCDHYTRRPGVGALCRAVAGRLAAYDLALDPDESVVITGGASETRYVALRALAAGETVYVPRTVLPEHQTALEFAGAQVTTFDPQGELPVAQGGLLLLPALDPDTAQRFPSSTLQRLALWAAESRLTVVADEIDLPLLEGDAGGQPFAAQPGMAERTLTLGGFAETPGLTAWKVAWFAGPPALVAKARTLKQAMTICTPAASQYAALGALEEDVK